MNRNKKIDVGRDYRMTYEIILSDIRALYNVRFKNPAGRCYFCSKPLGKKNMKIVTHEFVGKRKVTQRYAIDEECFIQIRDEKKDIFI